MNLAVSTLLVILALLPGIAAWNSYFSRTSRFPRQLFTDSRVQEMAYYVILALIVDFIGLSLVREYASCLGLDPGFQSLAETARRASQKPMAFLSYLRDHGTDAAFSYLGILAIAYVGGSVLRRFVWASRLDLYLPFLKMRHDWFYRLQGRLKGLPRDVAPVVDVLTNHPETANPDHKYPGSRLYRGVVKGFELSQDGSMEVVSRFLWDCAEQGSPAIG